jgi:hypothetical protein
VLDEVQCDVRKVGEVRDAATREVGRVDGRRDGTGGTKIQDMVHIFIGPDRDRSRTFLNSRLSQYLP